MATPPRLAIAAGGRHFVADGRPLGLCADTAWSALSETTAQEWREYLALRRAQGFNALLVSVLPIPHDRSEQPGSRAPFARLPGGAYDFGSIDHAYFQVARARLEDAVAAGMIPMLVLLWCNYVPGTWGAARTPSAVMPAHQRAAYLRHAVAAFADLNPVFVISGDDHLRDPEPIEVFRSALTETKRLAPHCLTTLHSTPEAVMPAALAESPALDFYIYQSGHYATRQALCHEIAERYRDLPTRPLMNAEPCYEAHGRAGTDGGAPAGTDGGAPGGGAGGGGRFDAREVRQAIWWSLLGGAAAGIGYGAHGVWQWHRSGAVFNNNAFSREPLPWLSALMLPGAWDAGFARLVMEEHGLLGAAARQDLLVDAAEGIRVASAGGTIAAYTPFAQSFALRADREMAVRAFDLQDRRRVVLTVTRHAGQIRIAQPAAAGDLLVLLSPQPSPG